MRKLSLTFILITAFYLTHSTAHSHADLGCLNLLKEAKETCKNEVKCIIKLLNDDGFDTASSDTEVFCEGDHEIDDDPLDEPTTGKEDPGQSKEDPDHHKEDVDQTEGRDIE